ncbi:hypothetical protein BJY52DRAFT_1192049 [Lactarius psammicola]|nr:hypothetical protein BJY52DRAFT_1192049 [Lactarius psammicola]
MANYDASYNPSADPALDDAAFTGEEKSEDYTTVADTSLETAAREDRDAAETDSHERPSKFEVDSLLNDVREDERNVGAGTRGKKVDAYKQEREVDRVTDQASEDDVSSANSD